MAKKSYYLGVTLTVKEYHKICITADRVPKPAELLAALESEDSENIQIDDTMDTETLHYESVEEIELLQEDEIEEDDE